MVVSWILSTSSDFFPVTGIESPYVQAIMKHSLFPKHATSLEPPFINIRCSFNLQCPFFLYLPTLKKTLFIIFKTQTAPPTVSLL